MFLLAIFLIPPHILELNAQTESLDVKLEGTNEKLDEMIDEIKKSNQHTEVMFWTAFFIGEIFAGIAIIFTVWNARELSKQTKSMQNQTDANANKNSVNLLFDLNRRIYSDFSRTVDLIYDADDGKNVVFRWDKLEKLLGELELVALAVRTPVIHVEHAYEIFSFLIDSIFNNRSIVDYIDRVREEDPEFFSGLKWLEKEFKIIKEEHIRHIVKRQSL